MIGVGRCRFLPHQPGQEVGIEFLEQRLEAIEFCPVHPSEPCIGVGPEQQVHFLGAAVPGAIAQAAQPHSRIFTGVFLKGHERVVSGNVDGVFTRISPPCHVADGRAVS